MKTALMYAKEVTIVNALIRAGAEVDFTDEYGMTALIWSACNSNENVVIALLSEGANVKARDNDDFSALDYAEDEDDKKIIALPRRRRSSRTRSESRSRTVSHITRANAMMS